MDPDQRPPEITGRQKREERANLFKLRDGWMRVPGSKRLLPPQDAVRILQHQLFPHVPSAIEQPPNHDQQMEYYQTTVRQVLHEQNQSFQQLSQSQTQALQEYQRTMQQSFGFHQPQYHTSGFVYEPATPAPNLSNPTPMHWYRPTAKSNATVIPQPAGTTSHESEPQPELQTKSSTAAAKTTAQPEALPKPRTTSSTSTEKTSQQPPARKKSRKKSTMGPLTDQRLAMIQKTHASILNYSPSPSILQSRMPLMSPVDTDMEFFPVDNEDTIGHTEVDGYSFTKHESHHDHGPITDLETVNSSPWDNSKGRHANHEPRLNNRVSVDSAIADSSPLEASKACTNPLSMCGHESHHDHGPSVKPQSMETIIEDFGYVLSSEPESKWTINDVPVDATSLEGLRSRYSGNTFQLLRATVRNTRPAEVHIMLPDEGLHSLPVTEKTTDVLFIMFQANRFTIGHWVMVWLDLLGVRARYYDVVGPDRDPNDEAFFKSCAHMIAFLKTRLSQKGLPDPGKFKFYREEIFEQADGENCGPISWAHVETVLDPSNKAAISKNPRLRHINQVYRSLLAVGVATRRASLTSDIVVVPSKRKQSDMSSTKAAKKVVQESTRVLRKQTRVPGQYREIPPLPCSDSDDDYIPSMQETEDEDEDRLSEYDHSD